MGNDAFRYVKGELYCEDVAVGPLAKQYGTPLYVYSATTIRDRYDAVDAALAGVAHKICFSVKSCPSLAVLATMARVGAGFDIVSGGELARVLAAGGSPANIVFAGASKGDDEIRAALDAGIMMFNVESAAELEALDAVAGEMGKTASFALRVNPDVDAGTHAKTTTGRKENKFGILAGAADRIVDGLARHKNLRMIGVDLHIGSPVNSVQPYADALAVGVDRANKWRAQGHPVQWLDAGGGYGLLYRDQQVPAFAEYGKVLVAAARAAGCKLIVEPGRSIVGNAAALVTSTRYIKETDAKRFVLVDAGMSDLARPAIYDAYHFCWPVKSDVPPPSRLFADADPGAVAAYLAQEDRDRDAPDRLDDPDAAGRLRADVVGPICESSDWLAKGRRLPAMARGDLLAVFSAGAYGMSMASTYNSRPRAAEVMVRRDEARLVRRRETLADLTSYEWV